MAMFTDLQHQAKACLMANSPEDKCEQAYGLSRAWEQYCAQKDQAPQVSNANRTRSGGIELSDNPGRPPLPELVDPRTLKRRRLGSIGGRIALLHAIAHIEFNAINLAADMVARFAHDPRIDEADRDRFTLDWIEVCDDEARHFELVCKRLGELGAHYGSLNAHDGLWSAARQTKDDIAARLAIAPMVLEARGLDVTPKMIANFKNVGDQTSASSLQIIYDDEIGHVAKGVKWFRYLCARENRDEQAYFKAMIKDHFKGQLKPPFNDEARAKSGFPANFYHPTT